MICLGLLGQPGDQTHICLTSVWEICFNKRKNCFKKGKNFFLGKMVLERVVLERIGLGWLEQPHHQLTSASHVLATSMGRLDTQLAPSLRIC